MASPAIESEDTMISGSEKKNPKNRETGEPDTTVIKLVQELADREDWKMFHVALAWIDKRVPFPIIGFSSSERIEGALGIRGKSLSDKGDRYLEKLYESKAIAGH